MTAAWSAGDAARDRGLHLGDGVFETVLLVDGAPQHLAAHLTRMRGSAATFGITAPRDLEGVLAAEVPRLFAAEGRPRHAALRITLSRGAWDGLEARDDALPGLTLAVRALPETPAAPARLVVVDQPRIDPASPLAGHKTLSWMPFVLARRAARSAGGDGALLRTTDGDVAEADAANVFFVTAGVCVTPSLDRGVLPGLTRARAIAALRAAGRRVEERPVSLEEALSADEAFLTSSLSGVRPAQSIGGRVLGLPGETARWLGACIKPSNTDKSARGTPSA